MHCLGPFFKHLLTTSLCLKRSQALSSIQNFLFWMCLPPDKPGPIQHLRVSDVRSDSAYLSWKDPEDNGGVRITNFVVEKKDTAATQWVPVCSSSKKRSIMLKHLMEGTSYMFRVAAENQYGRSEYVETPKAIKAMNPLCKCQHTGHLIN